MKLIKVRTVTMNLCKVTGACALVCIIGLLIAVICNAEMAPAAGFLFYITLPLAMLCFFSGVAALAANQELQKYRTSKFKDRPCSI